MNWLLEMEFEPLEYSDIEKHLFYEILYSKAENSVDYGIITFYNKSYYSIFIVNYKGYGEWIDLNVLNESQKIQVNKLKGRINPIQLLQINRESPCFYTELLFFPEDKENYISINKNSKQPNEKDLCSICFHHIQNYKYLYCTEPNCDKAIHFDCLNKDMDITQGWFCEKCRPCKFCYSSKEDKYHCTCCENCYHSECLHSTIIKPVDKESWKCENCNKCFDCASLINSLNQSK